MGRDWPSCHRQWELVVGTPLAQKGLFGLTLLTQLVIDMHHRDGRSLRRR
jgi:hypothetical protein